MTRLRYAWAAASSSLRMAWVGALVLGVVVVAVGVWRFTDDPVDSVVDAESLLRVRAFKKQAKAAAKT